MNKPRALLNYPFKTDSMCLEFYLVHIQLLHEPKIKIIHNSYPNEEFIVTGSHVTSCNQAGERLWERG